MQKKFINKWRITDMEQWDQDYVDTDGPGYIEFGKNGLGSLRFGYVVVNIDYRTAESSEGYFIEFSFSGNDECDEICDRGTVNQEGKKLSGHLYFHCGDESAFTAKPFA